MKDEDLLRVLENEVALLQERVTVLSELLLEHLSHKGEIIEFRNKLSKFEVEEDK